MERPQYKEKLFSITVNPPTTAFEFHHFGSNAAWIRAAYETLRPFPGFARGPRTLSVASTCCWPSGVRLRSFRPSCLKFRPLHDISTGLFGGPTACEARLAFLRAIVTGAGMPPLTSRTWAAGSVGPAGFTPLKTLLARPSQKLRKLKMALMLKGVLRPVTWRLLPNGPARTEVQLSTGPPLRPRKSRLKTPCEPSTSPLKIGKLAGDTVPPGPTVLKMPLAPGLIVFFVRVSAPAWKWHEAQACWPSPPVCSSQKSAFPSAIAASMSTTKSPR